jgi:hypothetical protein
MNKKLKAVKIKFFPWYWAYPNKVPVPAMKILNRDQVVRDGAGIKGKIIATIKAGAVVTIDTVEHDLGWSRVISVQGENPVPALWISAQQDKPEADREGWLDDTALDPFGEQPPIQPPTTGKVKWIITATIEQVEE